MSTKQKKLKSSLIINSYSILGIILCVLVLFMPTANAEVGDLFKPIEDYIRTITIIIVDRIFTVLGVLVILLQLLEIIWKQVSGESNPNLGKKIGWIFGIILIVILANWLKTNGATLFNVRT